MYENFEAKQCLIFPTTVTFLQARMAIGLSQRLQVVPLMACRHLSNLGDLMDSLYLLLGWADPVSGAKIRNSSCVGKHFFFWASLCQCMHFPCETRLSSVAGNMPNSLFFAWLPCGTLHLLPSISWSSLSLLWSRAANMRGEDWSEGKEKSVKSSAFEI